MRRVRSTVDSVWRAFITVSASTIPVCNLTSIGWSRYQPTTPRTMSKERRSSFRIWDHTILEWTSRKYLKFEKNENNKYMSPYTVAEKNSFYQSLNAMLIQYLVLTTHELWNSVIVSPCYSCTPEWRGPSTWESSIEVVLLLLLTWAPKSAWIASTSRSEITTSNSTTDSTITRRKVCSQRGECKGVLSCWRWCTWGCHNRRWIWGRRSGGIGVVTINHGRWCCRMWCLVYLWHIKSKTN